MPSNSGLTFCGGEVSGKTELCKILRNQIRKVVGYQIAFKVYTTSAHFRKYQ